MKKLLSNNWFPARAAIALVLLSNFSCGVRESSLMRLVPRESCAIMVIDWPALRPGEELRRILKGDECEALLRHLGVDSESVKTITIFSTVNSQANSGMLVRGAFERKKVAAQLKANGWHEESLDSHKIYVNGTDHLAMPVNNILVAGTREGVEAVFRASEDIKESIVASEAYKKVNAALTARGQPLTAFLLIPQGTLDMADAALTATSFALSFFNLGGVGQLLHAANVARGFAFSVDKGTDKKYPVELCVLLRDEDSARLINGSLNAMKTISELGAADNRDRESLRALREMTIVRNKEVLAVRLQIPASALFPPQTR